MFLKIVNRGEIEPAALFLVGASVKGENSIGFFGSGNKYAMSTLLRAGIEFHIFSGERETRVETTEVTFRGEKFNQIMLDGQPTSFTTRMGPTWETWFALREFVCNAIDEGGVELSLVDAMRGGSRGTTAIYVDCVPEVTDFFMRMDHYVFLGEPMVQMASMHYGKLSIVRESEGAMRVYRKGVCVVPSNEKLKSLYHYDFDQVTINESRVYVYEFEVMERIATALAMAPREVVDRFLSHLDDSTFVENNAYWSHVHDKFSQAWGDALEGRRLMADKYVKVAPAEDVLASVVLPDKLVDLLSAQFKGLDVWGVKSEYVDVLYGGENLQRAIDEVVAMGYLDANVKIKTVLFKSDSTIAAYDKKDCAIRLDTRYMDDYDNLVYTLVEEGSHHKGYGDGTRSYECYLVKELVAAKRNRAQ